MPKTDQQMLRRIRAAWTLLRWEGELRNARLQEVLGIQTLQATRIIRAFMEAHPDVLIQDAKGRRWLLLNPRDAVEVSFEEYVALLKGAELELPAWWNDGRIDFKTPDGLILQLASEACRRGVGLKVFYRSHSTPSGKDRIIWPHQIVRLSQRWHLRAWCGTAGEYRDFNFGRIIKASMFEEACPTSKPDAEWNRSVMLCISPHELLDGPTREMVRTEYLSGTTAMRLTTRAALAPYVLQEARVSTSKAEKPPQYILQLINAKELRLHLF